MSDERLIYVLDDDAAVRDSVCALLNVSGFKTEDFDSAAAFREGFQRGAAACALLDVRLPDANGLDISRDLRRDAPELPVIIMTGHADIPMAVEAMREGACDFLEKPFDDVRLASSLERAFSRSAPTDSSVDPDLREKFERLTPRETDVMQELIIGNQNKIIAFNLGLSPRTIEIHRGRVMKKLEATSLSHLVRMAIKAGFDGTAQPEHDQ